MAAAELVAAVAADSEEAGEVAAAVGEAVAAVVVAVEAAAIVVEAVAAATGSRTI